MPYAGKLNWDAITTALAKIGYEGDFSFELEGFFMRIDRGLMPDALKFAERTGRFLISKIEKAKAQI